MCGLVGAMSKLTAPLTREEISIFNGMLYCSGMRGRDSTGVMLWDGKTIQTLKGAFTPEEFINCKEYKKFLEDHASKALAIFGHTRLATVGRVRNENAHPFMDKNNTIALIHNGFVTDVPGVDVKTFEVDSKSLCVSLAKHKAEDVLKEFKGAIAAIWFNQTDKTVSFYRNSQRPLAIAEGHLTRWISSEHDMLKWLLGRAKIYPKSFGELKPNTMITVDLENLKNDPTSVEIQTSFTYVNNGGWETGYYAHHPVVVNHHHQENQTTKQIPFKKEKKQRYENEGVIALRSIAEYEKGKEIVLSAWDKEEYEPGKFRIICSPVSVAENPTPCTALIFCQQADLAQKLAAATILKGTIKNIKWDKNAKIEDDRVVLYIGDVKIVKE